MPNIPHEYTVRGKATAGKPAPPTGWHDWMVDEYQPDTATRPRSTAARTATSRSSPATADGSFGRPTLSSTGNGCPSDLQQVVDAAP